LLSRAGATSNTRTGATSNTRQKSHEKQEEEPALSPHYCCTGMIMISSENTGKYELGLSYFFFIDKNYANSILI
jgi:hypothetical protein